MTVFLLNTLMSEINMKKFFHLWWFNAIIISKTHIIINIERGNLMKKIMVVFALLLFSFGLYACDKTEAKTITFVTNEGTAIETVSFTDTYGIDKLSQVSTTREGYTFKSWHNDVALSEQSKVTEDIKETVTLYAKWEINTYEINYHLNDGINASGNPISYTIVDLVTLVNPTRDGYVFGGWYKEADFKTAVSSIAKGSKGTLDLYAKWQTDAYEITYHLNDGVNSNLNPVSYTVLDAITLSSPTRDGYVFAGWYKEADFVTAVTSIAAGSKGDLDLYAKWTEVVKPIFEITWQNEDGSTISVESFTEGVMPTYAGIVPVKSETDTHTFVFSGWAPALEVVSKNQTYVAQFTAQSKFAGKDYDKTELDEILGFAISDLLPTIVSSDYLITDVSDEGVYTVYVDLFDFTSAQFDAFANMIEATLLFNEEVQGFEIGDFFVEYYEDDETYPGLTVYGFVVYGEKAGGGNDDTSFDPTELNAILGFDFYALIPEIVTSDYSLVNDSEGEELVVYIDAFDWTETEGSNYWDALEAMFEYDETEQAFIVGNYFIYAFEDPDTYEGLVVYVVGIYNTPTADPVDPVEPVEGVYYEFNVQDTDTELTTSYGTNLNKVITFPGSDSKVVVKVSNIADSSKASSLPGGLSAGLIFAADVKNNPSALAYIEIDTLGNSIASFTFEIEARDAFTSRLKGGKVQVFDGSSWVDLAGGDFYSQITSDKTTITINNVNASKFRLVFTGAGDTSGNGGQFMLFNFVLASGSAPVIESWSDMIVLLGGHLNESGLSSLLPELEGITELTLKKINSLEYAINGVFAHEDFQTRVDNYLAALVLQGYEADEILSLSRGKSVYSIKMNDDLAYALYIDADGQTASVRVWKYDPVIEKVTLETLSHRQTINEFEIEKFGKSGLPSTGKYNALVIPVEIKGNPFPMDYEEKLNIAFNGTSLETGWESVASYYYKSSYTNLDVTFDIAPKFTTSNAKSFYEDYADEGDQYAIKEALLGLDSQIDYSQYDSNNDGLIDAVIFIYSVAYSTSTDPWWAWVFTAEGGVANDLSALDGKLFNYYFWASYSFINDTLPGMPNLKVNAETFVHEMGHLMGMPDLYPYNDALDYGAVGGFDMMDNNAGDHGPFNKMVLGWVQPLLATQGSYQVSLDAYSTDTDGLNNTLLIPYRASDLEDGNAFDEYLLVMFYTPNGLYNAHVNLPHVLDNAGIVIYHVDARLNSSLDYWGQYFRNNNDSTSNFLVEILEADFNNSIPGTSTSITQSDILTNGMIDLSRYKWNQGGNINVTIEIAQAFNNNSTETVLNINVA